MRVGWMAIGVLITWAPVLNAADSGPAKHATPAARTGAAQAQAQAKALHGVESPDVILPGLERLRLQSETVLVIDQDSGATLYTKNTEARAPIASITKLMTAMVVLDAHLPLTETVTITSADTDTLRHTRSRLTINSAFTREDLLQLALMASENRAATALARTYPGGNAAFVAAMNRKAVQLGMYDTRFVDASGLDSGNVSTAQDLAKMVKAAYQYPLIRLISTSPSYIVEMPGKTRPRPLEFKNTNSLVRAKNWDIGLSKTGYIRAAGHCLVMQTLIASRPLIIVLLDSRGKQTRLGDAQRIKHWLESGNPRQRYS